MTRYCTCGREITLKDPTATECVRCEADRVLARPSPEPKPLSRGLSADLAEIVAKLRALPANPDAPAPEPVCQRCQGAGFLRGDDGVIACDCLQPAIEADRMRRLRKWCALPEGVEPRLTLDNYRAKRPDQKAALEAARRLAEGGGLPWLVLSGERGTGKTHLAIGIILERLRLGQEGKLGKYVYTPDMLDEIRSGFDSGEARGILERYKSVPLLVLDDLGTQKTSEWVAETLDRLIDWRYLRRLPMVVTTNLPPDQLPARIGDRLCDRQISLWCVLDGPSYRRQGESYRVKPGK